MTTFAIATLGCKVNTYESQGYESALLEKGYEQVSFKEKADVYIINTCAVTNTAGSKSRQKIHAAIALNPEALIAVVGCYAQTASEQLEQDANIDILLGSDGKSRLADMIEEGLRKKRPQKLIHDVRKVNVFEALPIHRFEHQTRAFLKIQDGCNQFCSYCIIPFARGAERSLPEDEVLAIARSLSESGHREIVLSGIHTGRYGNGINSSLCQLMKRMVKEIPKLQRIRISSIEMNEITDELLEFIKGEEKIARHLHIPVQSANTTVLKNMNRPYTIAWFMERVDYEMEKIVRNILDPNTKATGKRKITVVMELQPDEDRENIAVKFAVKSTPTPTNPSQTMLYIRSEDGTGEVKIAEMTPQIPGQYSLEGTEQEPPAVLRLIK